MKKNKGAKKRAGRPYATDPRTERVNLSLTVEERDDLRGFAFIKGESTSGLGRKWIVEAINRRKAQKR